MPSHRAGAHSVVSSIFAVSDKTLSRTSFGVAAGRISPNSRVSSRARFPPRADVGHLRRALLPVTASARSLPWVMEPIAPGDVGRHHG